MTNLVPDSKKWYSVKEAALVFKMNPAGFRKLLKQYNDQVKNCIQIVDGQGPTGKTTLITKEGIFILANVKNVRLDSNSSIMEPLQTKKDVAEITLLATIPSEDPILANLQQMMLVRQQQLSHERRIDNLEQKIEEVKVLATEAPPTDLVTSQREFLNDRLRYLCQQTEMSHSYVWKKLHTYMCRESINDYKFGDFKPAIRYLKELYKSSHLDWN